MRVLLLKSCGYKIGRKVYVGEDLIVTDMLEDFSEKLVVEDGVAIAQRVTLVFSILSYLFLHSSKRNE